MECKRHRYASANSFSKNFKIIGWLDWERRNNFKQKIGHFISLTGRSPDMKNYPEKEDISRKKKM
jgi:hypothetical protein